MKERGDERRGVVRHLPFRAEHGLLVDPRRHENRRHTRAHEVVPEPVVLIVRPWVDRARGRHVVEDPAVLVERDDQQRLVPGGALAQRVVDLVQLLLGGHQILAGVVRRRAAAANPDRLQVAERRKLSAERVLVELIDVRDVLGQAGFHAGIDRRDVALEEELIREHVAGPDRRVVDAPVGEAVRPEQLEDGRTMRLFRPVQVLGRAHEVARLHHRGAGERERAVRVSAARNRAEPLVRNGEMAGEAVEDRQLLRAVGLHHLPAAVVPDEAAHVGLGTLRVAVAIGEEKLPQRVGEVVIGIEREELERIVRAQLSVLVERQPDFLVAIEVEELGARSLVRTGRSDRRAGRCRPCRAASRRCDRRSGSRACSRRHA